MRLIVTAMKNEGPYILEWAAYHLSIGFDRFLVYTNDCEDGTDAIWRRLARMGYGAQVDNDRIKARGVQKTALMRADDHPLTRAASWISCLDVDEFLNVKAGEGRLDDLIEAAGGPDAIMVAWRRFGANGVIGFQDRPVLEQFTRAAPEDCPYPFHNYGVKSLWRANGAYRRIGVHRPLDPDPARLDEIRITDAAGRDMPDYREKRLWLTPQTAAYETAQVNHYSLRSAQGFLVKCERGLPNSKITALDLGYWAERNFNTVEERSIARRLPAMRETLAMLKADEELGALHKAACEWHVRKIGALLRDAEMLKTFLRIIMTEAAVLPAAYARGLNPLIARSWEMDRAGRKGGA